ncbi:vomeronasal type-2 receptor 26-like [Gastrophryne carolinensis]
MKCLDIEWPNDEKTVCIPKTEEFLSYSDGVAKAICSFSVLLVIATLLIFMIFITKWNTPVVKANNQNLSVILLVSIKMAFLCVFLFIGRPVDATCMFRHALFGVIFSVAVSSILGKTITVFMAFKASKPGSNWRKMTGTNTSNSLVFICSSVQIVLCITWLSLSPPFQELNTRSFNRKVVVQCNEGSSVFFYSLLAYLGLLAGVTLLIAYLARSLPDSFNEAKYITFSMLVFYSVWAAMIPAYLSTKGKYLAAVEVFAILMSSAGLLTCIFLPKCFIIVFKPAINTKSYMYQSKKCPKF